MDYPTNLPQPVREEYSNTITSKTNRIVMDDGFARPTRVVTDAQFTRTLRWNLKHHQKVHFNDWWARSRGQEVTIPIEKGAPVTVRLAGALPSYEPSAIGIIARLTVLEIKQAAPYEAGLQAWPQELPSVNIVGYSLAAGGTHETPEVTIFQTVSRRRFNAIPAKVTATITLSLEERNVFWEFYGKLGNGVRYFTVPLVDHIGEFTARCYMDSEPRESSNSSGFDIALTFTYTARALVMTGL